jgi:hypothetical protein
MAAYLKFKINVMSSQISLQKNPIQNSEFPEKTKLILHSNLLPCNRIQSKFVENQKYADD